MSTHDDTREGRPPPSDRSDSIPFPSEGGEQQLKESASSSSNLTSSDKLSALPTQTSPVLERLKSPGRAARRNMESSTSLTSIDSATGSLRALHSLPGTIRQSESESSIAKDTPRQRNSSERSLPATLQNVRQFTDLDTYPSIRAWSVRSQELLLCQHEARARSVFVPKSLRVGATPVIDEGVLPNSLNTMRMYALLT
ncbi:hypothetical protein OH76DRAFT_662028 [Lentinus brumalis]|uniref:Uncharacterized protein n=1 Tax=Lentinus brumalis TaxID=2498619 RepID=A0A371D7S7_9APHY|nr:hypothetical protein OH76DRAFT_662028 [Polyporus brumalis]